MKSREGNGRIRNVIFDLGGVLVTWRPAEIAAGFYDDPALREALFTRVFQHQDWLDLDRGVLHETEAAGRFGARLGRPVAELATLFDRVRESLQPIDATVALLRDLRARGLKLYALSNISERNYAYLCERNSFFTLFDGAVVSAAVKLLKPDPRIYEHLTAQFGIVPQETVFIDDMARNVESAAGVGLKTILFESTPQCARDLERWL